MRSLLGSWLFVNAAALLVGVCYILFVRQPAKLVGDQLLTTPMFVAAATWLALALIRKLAIAPLESWRE